MSNHGDPCHGGKPHEHTKLGQVYEYCEDCGAVRKRQDLEGSTSDKAWHSCSLCRLPAARAS